MNILRTLIATAALLPVIAGAQGVDHRQHEQHRRIEQGIRHGSLTHREAAGLRAREAALRAREKRDRFFHHGHLTPRERARIERSQNHLSHDIDRQKHDRQHRHG